MRTPPDLLDYFPPGLSPRHAQVELLQAFQEGYRAADVVVLGCPPAFGKTEIAYAIAHWLAAQGITANYLVPDNVLVRQTADRYPQFCPLFRKDMYACEHPDHEASGFAKACGNAAHRRARDLARDSDTRLMNTHVYRANKLYAEAAIFDEAHKIRDLLDEDWPVRIWHHDYAFPAGLGTVADVIAWGQSHLRTQPTDERLRTLLLQVARVRDTSNVEYVTRMYRNAMAPALEVRCCLARLAKKRLWPDGLVSKIVLMSATIGSKDIAELGLDRRRVLYLAGDSPIPAAQRPIVYKPVCVMSSQRLDHALPLLAKELLATMDREPGKGLIHVPYNIADRLRPLFQHPRLLWHTKRDKQDVLAAFRAAPAESGAVLVCSGLYEGVDLPFDDDSWQVIGKVPYLSLGDEFVKQHLAEDPDWYDWQAIKRLLQAYGRLPRRPDGRGTTYIFDINYARLLKKDRSRETPMFPKHYMAATQGGRAS